MTIAEVKLDYAERALKKFHNTKSVNSQGCYIPRKKPRKDGYVRFSITKGSSVNALGYPTGETTFYIHHLSWYVAGRSVPEDSTCAQISHLCHNSTCFNVEHLVLEDPKTNNSRKGCLGTIKCDCCGHNIKLCKHIPPCKTHL